MRLESSDISTGTSRLSNYNGGRHIGGALRIGKLYFKQTKDDYGALLEFTAHNDSQSQFKVALDNRAAMKVIATMMAENKTLNNLVVDHIADKLRKE